MNNFRLARPNMTHEKAALEFIQEFLNFQAPPYLRGTGGLENYLDNYPGWLEKLSTERVRNVDEDGVPNETFFFLGDGYDKTEYILGICNINYALNPKLWAYKHHIGYSIRPTERGHSYAKRMLYCMVRVCAQRGMEAIIVGCDANNIASSHTIRSLGGKLIARYNDPEHERIAEKFVIDVRSSANNYLGIYDQILAKGFINALNKGGEF